MRLLWLAEDCVKAGLKVVQVSGWKTRGAEFPAMPNTVIAHHTATPATARGDLPTKKLLIDGRSDLPGPLCQVGLGRNGTVYVIASGKANHAGKGAWAGVTSSEYTVGIEAEHPGGTAPYTPQQYAAYVTLTAVLLRGLGSNPQRVAGHKEWALPKGRKVDPALDMGRFRTDVRVRLAQLTGTPAKEFEDMTADEVRAIFREELAAVEKRLHNDHVVMIRGTSTGSHPFNLKTIAEKLGIIG